MPEATFCRPNGQLCCFACCPPIRPQGYEHVDHKGTLVREFSRNREDFLAGKMPSKEIVGYSCPGLGFLDSKGKTVGCLYHPAQNQGEDLRAVTGYQEKCARETCPSCRTFARITPKAQDILIAMCRGMDSFTYSSFSLNPVMRLLAFGPRVAEEVTLLVTRRDELEEWLWLSEAPPAWGHFLAELSETHSPEVYLRPDLTSHAAELVSELRRGIMPLSPLSGGESLARLCDEWEARFWRETTGQEKTRQHELSRWRDVLSRVVNRG